MSFKYENFDQFAKRCQELSGKRRCAYCAATYRDKRTGRERDIPLEHFHGCNKVIASWNKARPSLQTIAGTKNKSKPVETDPAVAKLTTALTTKTAELVKSKASNAKLIASGKVKDTEIEHLKERNEELRMCVAALKMGLANLPKAIINVDEPGCGGTCKPSAPPGGPSTDTNTSGEEGF